MVRLVLTFTMTLVALVSHKSYGQKLDFDSLIQVNANFRSIMDETLANVDLFSEETPLRVTLEANFKAIRKSRFEDEYHPAVLRYPVNDTVMINREIKVKPRGNMRLKTCAFPPLKVNFPKNKVFMKQLQDFDKMKMVVNCKKGAQYGEYLLSEYYAYKIYNVLSPFSLRVRLIEITYIDTSNGNSQTQYAFIIEDLSQLAQRINALETEMIYVKDKFMNIDVLTNMYLFQYMIGNTDWSVYAKHNIDLLIPKEPSGAKPLMIPYDFDYSGIVGTPYAIPAEELEIETVKERDYRGFCDLNDELAPAIEHHRKLKSQIYDVYNNSLLTPAFLNKTIKYLDQYYQIIENDSKIRSMIYGSCQVR